MLDGDKLDARLVLLARHLKHFVFQLQRLGIGVVHRHLVGHLVGHLAGVIHSALRHDVPERLQPHFLPRQLHSFIARAVERVELGHHAEGAKLLFLRLLLCGPKGINLLKDKNLAGAGSLGRQWL